LLNPEANAGGESQAHAPETARNARALRDAAGYHDSRIAERGKT
jgi:hypothetical protein